MDSIGGIRPDITIGSIRSDKKPSIEKPSLLESKDEVIKSLSDENAKLRAQLQEMKTKLQTAGTSTEKPAAAGSGKIVYEIGENLLMLRDVKTKDTIIDRLDVKVEGGSKILGKMMSMDTMLEGGGRLPTNLTADFMKMPLEVRDLRMRIPDDTATRAFLSTKSESLKNEGISNLDVSFKNGNKIVLSGTRKKLLSIPFSIEAGIGLSDDNRIKIDVEKMKVMGLIPVPRLIQTIAMVLTDESMTDKSLERNGDTYLIDPGALLPKNIKLNLKSIGTKNGELVLEAGEREKPGETGKSL